MEEPFKDWSFTLVQMGSHSRILNRNDRSSDSCAKNKLQGGRSGKHRELLGITAVIQAKNERSASSNGLSDSRYFLWWTRFPDVLDMGCEKSIISGFDPKHLK